MRYGVIFFKYETCLSRRFSDPKNMILMTSIIRLFRGKSKSEKRAVSVDPMFRLSPSPRTYVRQNRDQGFWDTPRALQEIGVNVDISKRQ